MSNEAISQSAREAFATRARRPIPPSRLTSPGRATQKGEQVPAGRPDFDLEDWQESIRTVSCDKSVQLRRPLKLARRYRALRETLCESDQP
jgi:hypothetical protein